MKSFLAHEVRFLVIGGYAASFYGQMRNTATLDVWIASQVENRRRAIQALRELAFPSVPDTLLDNPDDIVRMGVPPLRIEILQSISGVGFDACWPNRAFLQDGELSVPMISLPD